MGARSQDMQSNDHAHNIAPSLTKKQAIDAVSAAEAAAGWLRTTSETRLRVPRCCARLQARAL